MVIPRPHFRFTVDDYERLIELGMLTAEHRVELIRGEIVEMSPIGGPHNAFLNRVNRAATRQTADDLHVQIHGPIRLPTDGEPQPDLAIVRVGYDERRPPTPAHVLLVGEVADSSLEYDRGVKLPVYAAAGIPEAWLFNLVAMRIERHSDPTPTGYRTIAYAEGGQHLTSTVLTGLTFDADELFGMPQR